MLRNDLINLVFEQMAEVQAPDQQPNLELELECTGEIVLKGTVSFSIDHKNRTYEDAYQIEITIPPDYPDSVPTARETEGVIPIDFHHDKKAERFCLAVPEDVYGIFAQNRTLLGFINKLVIPYLFSYTYYRDNGTMPHDERPHYTEGRIEYYTDFFGTDFIAAMKLLKLLVDDFAPPLMPCPCKSGRQLQNCHGHKLEELKPILPLSKFKAVLLEMITFAKLKNIPFPERDVTPKQTLKNRQRRQQRASSHR